MAGLEVREEGSPGAVWKHFFDSLAIEEKEIFTATTLAEQVLRGPSSPIRRVNTAHHGSLPTN